MKGQFSRAIHKLTAKDAKNSLRNGVFGLFRFGVLVL
jgi:hypothetical protein